MNHRLAVALAGALSLAITGCSTSEPPAKADATAISEAANPLFTASTLPFGYPPFDKIHDEHFVPAFEKGIAEHAAEIEAIANSAEPATFDNTIVAMERSGQLLDRVQTIFFSLAGANTNDALEQKIGRASFRERGCTYV